MDASIRSSLQEPVGPSEPSFARSERRKQTLDQPKPTLDQPGSPARQRHGGQQPEPEDTGTSPEIALRDVTEVLKWLLNLGEVGVCTRLLESLEISSLSFQPIGGKGSNSASKFKHVLKTFVTKDRLAHPDPGTSFLDRWATRGQPTSPKKSPRVAKQGEEPKSGRSPRKKTNKLAVTGKRLEGKKFHSGPPPDRSPKDFEAAEGYKSDVSNGILSDAADNAKTATFGCPVLSVATICSTNAEVPVAMDLAQLEMELQQHERGTDAVAVKKANSFEKIEQLLEASEKTPTVDQLIEAYQETGADELKREVSSPTVDFNNVTPGYTPLQVQRKTSNRLDAGPPDPSSLVLSPAPPSLRSPISEGPTPGGRRRPSSQGRLDCMPLSGGKSTENVDGSRKNSVTSLGKPPDRKNSVTSVTRSKPPNLQASPTPSFYEKRQRRQKSLDAGSNQEANKFPDLPIKPGPLTLCVSPAPPTRSPAQMNISPEPSQVSQESRTKLLASTALGRRASEPWNPGVSKPSKVQSSASGGPEDLPKFRQLKSDPIVNHWQGECQTPGQRTSTSLTDSQSDGSGLSELDNESDSDYQSSGPGSPRGFRRSDSQASLDFDALEAHDAEWFGSSSHRFMIHPNSNARLAWDVASLILIFMEGVTVPLVTSFNMFLPEALFSFVTAFFTCDLVLNFLTGYFRDGLLVMRQPLVVRLYLRGFFIIDFLSTMPWDLLISTEGAARTAKLLLVVRLVRMVKLRYLLTRMEDLFSSYLFAVALNLFKFLMGFVLLCHWTACVWGYIGNPFNVGHSTAGLPPHKYHECEPGGPCEAGLDGSPWLRRYGYESYGSGTQYLAALHFAVGLVTANEMDIRPGYWGERVYSILLMIISLSVTSIVISQAVVILNKINQGRAEFRERMQFIKEFMQSRKVSMELQVKVKRYLEYQFKSMKEARAHIGFVEDLSPWIRLELTEHLNKDIITRHPFFDGLPSSIIKHFCARAQTVLYAPGDVVVQRGHLASCIGFIVKGRLRIVSKSSSRQSILESPCWIGDTSIFVEMVRKFTIISITHSELLTITKEVVMELLNEFPKLETTYSKFRQKVEEGDFIGCGAQCQHCLQFGHRLADCPRLARGMAGALSLPMGVENTGFRMNSRESLSSQAEISTRSRIQGFFSKFRNRGKSPPPQTRFQRRRSSGGVAPVAQADQKGRGRSPFISQSSQNSPTSPQQANFSSSPQGSPEHSPKSSKEDRWQSKGACGSTGGLQNGTVGGAIVSTGSPKTGSSDRGCSPQYTDAKSDETPKKVNGKDVPNEPMDVQHPCSPQFLAAK